MLLRYILRMVLLCMFGTVGFLILDGADILFVGHVPPKELVVAAAISTLVCWALGERDRVRPRF